jgi:catechol 2,3-dioxygenase-like lactoylglutathione lyase family enzyme
MMLNRPEFRGFHHLTLTITDVNQSRQFYTDVLGFQVIAEISSTWVVVGNNHMFFGLTQPTDPTRAELNDRFNENRVD